MAFQTLRYSVDDRGVATIALDRPEARNALSDEALDELIAAFEQARDDGAVRCVVLASTHEKVFSAGGDLGQFPSDAPLIAKYHATDRFVRLFQLIGALGKPSLCAANGHVLAGALGLALACDLIIAKDTARFGTPEINVGVFPFMIMALIFRNVGRKKASELLLLGERLGARIIGAPGEGRRADWQEDLVDSRGCLLEAGGQVDDALAAGAFPVLFASDCSICMTTLPAVVRHHPGAVVLWLDAHGDFNTPDTTPSGFLGGMCLAAACGVWDPGLGGLPRLDASHVVMCGVRDLDGGERVLLETNGVVRVTRPSHLADLLRDREVYVHLDCDVLDPSVLPAQFPAPGGLSDGGLRTLLSEVAGACTVIGVEVTAFGAPELAELIATVIEPLVPDTTGSPA